MHRRIIVFTIALSAMSVGSASAQQCLHGQGETPDQAIRRRSALVATRMINTIQINQPGAKYRRFLRHAELATSGFGPTASNTTSDTLKRVSLNQDEEVVPGWKLTLDVTENGYWLMIKDVTDPCGFAFISNQEGVIFTAEPIR